MKTLKLVGEVDDTFLIKTLLHLEKIETPVETIQIDLCTEGGYVHTALAIYDALRRISNPVQINVIGACMSAGTVILGGADYRTASINAQFMVHYGEAYNDSEDTSRHNRKVGDLTKRILSEYTGKSKRTVNSWYRLQKFFLVDEALKLGFINEIKK